MAAVVAQSSTSPLSSSSPLPSWSPTSPSQADASIFACPCLNVRIIVPARKSADAKPVEPVRATRESREAQVATQFVVPAEEAQACRITIAQPLVTAREVLGSVPSSTSANTPVALRCLNCGTLAYAIDEQKSSEGLIHNAKECTSTSLDGNQTLPLPVQRGNQLWVLESCLFGVRAIERTASSQSFSKAFGLVIQEAASSKRKEGRELIDEEEEHESGGEATDDDEIRSPRRRRPPGLGQQQSSTTSPIRAARTTRSTSGSGSGSGSGSRSGSRQNRQSYQNEDDVDTLRLLSDLLPPAPSHIVAPSATSSSSSSASTMAGSLANSSSNGTARRTSATNAHLPLRAHIESVAQAELRAIRQDSLDEVYSVLKRRRKELLARETKIRNEALKLMARVEPGGIASAMAVSEDKPASSPNFSSSQQQTSSSAGTAQSGPEGSPLFERRRPLAPSSQGAATSFGTSMDDHQGTPTLASSTLPSVQSNRAGAKPMRFDTSTATAPALSSSIGALSASFAMRGRDPPPVPGGPAAPQQREGATMTAAPSTKGTAAAGVGGGGGGGSEDLQDEKSARERRREQEEDEEDWYAHKRRMRERYPHADHSALPSAANSDDEETGVRLKGGWLNDEDDEDDAEERGAWQGKRDEQRKNSKEARRRESGENPAKDDEDERNVGERGRGRGRDRGAALSSSVTLGEKSRALTGVSEGSADALMSPSQSRRQGPKKGALKGGSALADTTSSSSRTSTQGANRSHKDAKSALQHLSGIKVGAASSEKKVMFKENAEEVGEGAFEGDDGDEEEEDDSSGKKQKYTEPLDEGANALFEIDEDIDEGDEEAASADPKGRKSDTLQDSELKRGQEQLLEEEAKRRGAFESSQDKQRGEEEEEEEDGDEDGDGDGETTDPLYEEHVAQSVPHVGSFAALVEARSLQSGRGSLLRRDDLGSGVQGIGSPEPSQAGFDPASLRLDARPSLGVVPPQRGVIGNLSETSFQRVAARSSPFSDDDGGKARTMMGPSKIGFRVAINEAEARLSGLLAPHAPSHRSLWTGAGRQKSATSDRRSSKERAKYIDEDLEDNDDDAREEIKSDDEKDSGDGSRSWMRRRRAAAIASATNAIGEDSEMRFAPGSMPIGITSPPGARSFGGRNGGAFTSFGPGSRAHQRDQDTSGFDLEPKTSLPYREKKMTPSLRKATRTSSRTGPTLSTITDTAETTSTGSSSVGTVGTEGSLLGTQPHSEEPFKPGKPPMPARRSSGAVPFAAAVAVPSASKQVDESAVTVRQEKADKPTIGFDPNEASVSLRSPRPASTAIATPQVNKLAAPDSGKATPVTASPSSTSSARRSPQPPYIAPPPPTSTGLRLQPDPSLAPAPVSLFDAQCDETLAANEVGEEEELDYGKVLHFMHRIEMLKINKRTGWLHHRVEKAESIADHMYRMALLSLLLPGQEAWTSEEGEGEDEKKRLLDLGKCVQLCIVHDLAEAEVGDLTPLDGVSREEKLRREAAAIQYLVHDLLGSNAAGLRIERLWNEYEARETAESKAVKDLDRFELCLQAVEYERQNDIRDLQPFFEGSINLIRHPRLRQWAVQLAKERQQLWENRGLAYKQAFP